MMGELSVITDSTPYLPVEMIEKIGISVVPVTVILDDKAGEQFVGRDSAEFSRLLGTGAKDQTSQPSPGRFLTEYERLASAGARQIVSMHMGASPSGTANSATVAAEMSPIPARVVDTGQAPFIEGLCVVGWLACRE